MRIPRYLFKLSVFKTQQLVLGNSVFKLAAVFLASVPAILIGGAAYKATSGKTMLDGIANVYGAIYKIPGEIAWRQHVCACHRLSPGHMRIMRMTCTHDSVGSWAVSDLTAMAFLNKCHHIAV